MKLINALTKEEHELVQRLDQFIPPSIFDIHAHLFNPAHFVKENIVPLLKESEALGMAEFKKAVARWLPGRTVEGLFFGFPSRGNDRPAINKWMTTQALRHESNNRVLALVSPEDKPEEVAEEIRRFGFVGLKPYHVYASLGDTSQAQIEDFAPEWMWEICHGMKGVLMLHIMRNQAIADPDNQATIRRLCRKYPDCRLVLAHVARSFSYRHARKGLSVLTDLDNVWVDTSAVTETESIRRAIEVLGPQRVLYGSDYPVSDFRGRCVAINNSFLWVDTESFSNTMPKTEGALVGLESLLCLQEACEDAGLNPGDVENIFRNNALRLLAPHLEESVLPERVTGPELWAEASTKVSGGTGLRSKWADRYDPQSWPSYFSRCQGSEVWDLEGRRLVDFTGAIGAVLLGYADPDVTRAVKRRLNLGTHCSLCTPDEVELADLLLELHPWAGRVRYARGGGEAMGIAVRIARAATGRSGIAFCGYHGWQDWYLAANLGDDSALDGHLLPGLQPRGVPRELKGTAVPFRYNDLASFEKAMARLDGNLAGVVMEPMRSECPRDGFLEKIAQRCRAAGGVFVVDEVTSGWRFGFPGAMTTLGVEPDIAVYAKAMSNGIPCAAVVGKEAVMDEANESFISSTYWTDGIGPAAAIACIRKMRATKMQENLWISGNLFQQRLRELAARHPETRLVIGGQPTGPSFSFDLGANAQAAKQVLVRRMIGQGILMSSQLYLMLTHTEAHFSAMLTAMDAALTEIGALLAEDRLKSEAGFRDGAPAAMGEFARLA